ncbi:TIGR00269 family protein [archaeon]|nr:TIGR00269 family protein [archaeon]|tara:strand:+ start:659 stop:1579 length:921 start_codon:yes stop_codon:yes gene_type:complete
MNCKNCIKKPVITLTNSSIKLCRSHFIKYFEKKVNKTILKYNLIEDKDKIGIALSGGKDSLTVLHILNKIRSKNKDIKLEAILIDEGIKDYRDKTIKDAIKFCKLNKIKLNIFSYKKEFGSTLDSILKKNKIMPCSICGTFRRYLLNKKSKELNFTKLATGHNLDDESQSILMNQFRNNQEINARLGPITGLVKNKNFIRRIKPLFLVNEKEVATYAFLKGFKTEFSECPHASIGYRHEIRDLLNNFEKKYPGTKVGLVNSFLETLSILKEKYKKKHKKINYCSICQEPTSKEKCQACTYVEKLKI